MSSKSFSSGTDAVSRAYDNGTRTQSIKLLQISLFPDPILQSGTTRAISRVEEGASDQDRTGHVIRALSLGLTACCKYPVRQHFNEVYSFPIRVIIFKWYRTDAPTVSSVLATQGEHYPILPFYADYNQLNIGRLDILYDERFDLDPIFQKSSDATYICGQTKTIDVRFEDLGMHQIAYSNGLDDYGTVSYHVLHCAEYQPPPPANILHMPSFSYTSSFRFIDV